VRDCEPRVRQPVNRHQDLAFTAHCADRLRRVAALSVHLDPIHALPYQTVASVIATVQQALSIEPDCAVVFGCAHVPWIKQHQGRLPEDALPGRPGDRHSARRRRSSSHRPATLPSAWINSRGRTTVWPSPPSVGGCGAIAGTTQHAMCPCCPAWVRPRSARCRRYMCGICRPCEA
jgi:hypothetical protein